MLPNIVVLFLLREQITRRRLGMEVDQPTGAATLTTQYQRRSFRSACDFHWI
jgi:hypothetical protein